MMPVLYGWREFANDDYHNNGKGILRDAISCEVTEEINGSYDLFMKYPLTGIHGKDIQEWDIILAKPNPRRDPEPFRIYSISRPIKGTLTIRAHHISYDLINVPVMPFVGLTPNNSAMSLKTNMAFPTKFTLSGLMDSYKSGKLEIKKPTNARAVLLGESNSIASTFFTESSGQIYFSWYTVQIQNTRGSNRGFKIVYGKNMTDYIKETDMSDSYTGILPYIINADNSITTLPEKIVTALGETEVKRILPVEFPRMVEPEDTTEETMTEEEYLRESANQYIQDYGIGKLHISLDVSFVNLKDTIEYKDLRSLQDVYIGDTVEVLMPMYGSSTEICSKTVYDVLTDRFLSISVGKLRKGI